MADDFDAIVKQATRHVRSYISDTDLAEQVSIECSCWHVA
jgi:hypothetical protein